MYCIVDPDRPQVRSGCQSVGLAGLASWYASLSDGVPLLLPVIVGQAEDGGHGDRVS